MVLQTGARLKAKDVEPVMLSVSFVFLRRVDASSPISFVHDGDDTSPAANELMPRDLVDLEAFWWWRDVDRDVEGWGLCGEGVERVFM